MTTRKILVADDNANIRKVVKMGFEALGYTVLTAENGRVALEKIRAERPDLVILDVMMPEKSGYDVCAEMKGDAELRSIPVVLLPAKNLEEDQYWGNQLTSITKPTTPRSWSAPSKIFAGERGETTTR
jgi:CheY-like chemotaxis protein